MCMVPIVSVLYLLCLLTKRSNLMGTTKLQKCRTQALYVLMVTSISLILWQLVSVPLPKNSTFGHTESGRIHGFEEKATNFAFDEEEIHIRQEF